MSKFIKGSLADMLPALMILRNQLDHAPQPVGTSFPLDAANDHCVAKRESLTAEMFLRTEPSLRVIEQEMERQREYDDKGRLVAIGKLRFSDGTTTEQAFKRGPDGTIVKYDRQMPEGAMMGCKETLSEYSGGRPAKITIGNSTFSKRFGLGHRVYIPNGERRRGRSYSQAESKAMLADAIANTPVMPTIIKCPPGMASGTAQYSDQFIGMKIGSTGRGGAENWTDVFSAGEDRIEADKAFDGLSRKDKAVLKAAMKAKSMAEVGVAAGQSPEYARRKGGKAALIAANDNYIAAMKKISA